MVKIRTHTPGGRRRMTLYTGAAHLYLTSIWSYSPSYASCSVRNQIHQLRTHSRNDSVIEAEIKRSARFTKQISIFAVCTRHRYFAVITFRSVYTFSRFCRHRESDQGILLNYFVKVNHLPSMFIERRRVLEHTTKWTNGSCQKHLKAICRKFQMRKCQREKDAPLCIGKDGFSYYINKTYIFIIIYN